MDRLLVFADDHSASASTAWEWVCAQHWAGWAAEVVTVVPDGLPGQAESEPQEWEPAVRRVPYESTALGPVRHIRASGDPRIVLAGLDADLLVIGERGTGIAKKLHLGSVAEWLINCPRVPTVIAKKGARVERVVLAVDGSPHAHRAAEEIAAFPWATGLHVDVVAVEIGDGVAAAGAEECVRLLGRRGADVRLTVIRPYDWDLTVNVRGDILQFLYEHPCDLLVLGTRGLQGWERLRIGSTADYLVHHVDCPVLLARCAE